jgi:repressor LexA
MNTLTDRQQHILNIIIKHLLEHGGVPSIRELQPMIGVKSIRGVTVHFDALERKGYIQRGTSWSRDFRILRNAEGQKVRLVLEVVE